MQKFLLHCKEHKIKQTAKNYNDFVRENDLTGSWSTIYAKTGSFTDFRNRVAKDLDLGSVNILRSWTDEQMIDAIEEFLETNEKLTCAEYEEWRKEHSKPGVYAVLDRLDMKWNELKESYGIPVEQRHSTEQTIDIGKTFCDDCLHYNDCEHFHRKEECSIWKEWNND